MFRLTNRVRKVAKKKELNKCRIKEKEYCNCIELKQTDLKNKSAVQHEQIFAKSVETKKMN